MKAKYLFVFMVIAALSGCNNALFKKIDILKKDSSQILTLKGCGDDIKVSNKSTPPDLYQGIVKCINNRHYNNGVILFSLSGTYSYFDVSRMADATKKNIHTHLLAKAMNSVDDEDKSKREAFREKLQQTLSDKFRLVEVCAQVRNIGMPHYSPDYINTSGTFVNYDPNNDIDQSTHWQNALQGYLHCPP